MEMEIGFSLYVWSVLPHMSRFRMLLECYAGLAEM